MRLFPRTATVVIFIALSACHMRDALVLQPTTFDALPAWHVEDHSAALAAYQKSCTKRLKKDALSDACEHALVMHEVSQQEASAFFEEHFTPYSMQSRWGARPLLTGYYIPTLKASRTKTDTYRWPAYALPKECTQQTCYSRAEIDAGALENRELEIVWFDDPVMLFFTHIQGSATVAFDDCSRAMLRYAGHNGHDYVAIGRWLIEEGEVAKEDMSLDAIRDWMRANPDKQTELMQRNPRFIFFSLDEEDVDAKGAEGTALTAQHSLAVDPEFTPYGSLIFAALEGTSALPEWNHLMVAQDTGSAITGPLRGDVFFGYGTEAERLASDWQQSGEMFLLVEKMATEDTTP